MKSATKQQQTCCYCGDSFAAGEDVLHDSSPLFAPWEAIRDVLVFPYHRVCWCWDRIDRWLRAHAPLIYQQLGNRATEEEIALTEHRFHARFPLDLRRSYRIHNGSGNAWFFEQGQLLSLQEMKRIADQAWKPAGEIAWSYIPIVANGGGDYCYVDCSPSTSGVSGQVFWLRHESGAKDVLALRFECYLERFTDALERGGYVEKQSGSYPALVSCHQ